MIVEWIVSVGAAIASWVATLFPVLDIPPSLTTLDDSMSGIFAMGTGLGAWIDWPTVGTLMAVPLIVWVAGLTIRGIRALLAHLPFIGGRG